MLNIMNTKQFHCTQPSDTVSTFVLSSGTGQSDTTPADARYMRLTGTAAFYVLIGTTAAALPSTSVAASTSVVSALVPANESRIYLVNESEAFSVISSTTPTITAEFWSH